MARWSRRLYNKKLPPKPVRPWQVRIEEGGVEPPVLAYSNYPRARAAAEKACPGFRGHWQSLFYAAHEDWRVTIIARRNDLKLFKEALQWRDDHLAELVLLRQPLGAPEQVVASWWVEPDLAVERRETEFERYPHATHARIYLPSGEVLC